MKSCSVGEAAVAAVIFVGPPAVYGSLLHGEPIGAAVALTAVVTVFWWYSIGVLGEAYE